MLNENLFGMPTGVLLLDQSIHNSRPGRERRQICDDWNRCDYGKHDAGGHAADGQNWSENITPLWSWWNVYIFNIHNDIIVNHGKLLYER